MATGNPPPTVVWSRQLVNGSTALLWNRKYVKIKELSNNDYGNYTCTAQNSQGTDVMVIDIRGKRSDDDDNDKVMLQW